MALGKKTGGRKAGTPNKVTTVVGSNSKRISKAGFSWLNLKRSR